jgi:hypothetical protein
VVPETFAAYTERRHDADARDDDACLPVERHGVTIIRAVQRPTAELLFAWTGALVFVLALGYFVYSYTITFAEPADSALSAAPITWNVALFTIFALHHSIFSRLVVRDWVARTWPRQLERSFYVWMASLLFIAVCALWQPVGGFAWHVTGGNPSTNSERQDPTAGSDIRSTRAGYFLSLPRRQ